MPENIFCMQNKIMKKQNKSMTSTELDSSSRESLKNSGNNWQNLTKNLKLHLHFFQTNCQAKIE